LYYEEDGNGEKCYEEGDKCCLQSQSVCVILQNGRYVLEELTAGPVVGVSSPFLLAPGLGFFAGLELVPAGGRHSNA
jgi:hypothetical protein